MSSLEKMNAAIEYIEDNLENEIDYEEIAKIVSYSDQHFRRMFSFISGVTLSEYVRRRRLTLAAIELKENKMRVLDVALKYGYDSPDSFSRAFQSLHGVNPLSAKKI